MNALPWSTAWRIARRDLHRRFRGLRLLLICLFLGVGALAAIGTLTEAIRSELSAQGRIFLGGDLEVEVWQRPLTQEENTFLSSFGTLSQGLRMQAMASTADAATPVELKAVDRNWPLYGRLELEGGHRMGAPPPGQAWIAPGAAERLGIGPGDMITIGTEELRVGGIIADEPDRLSEGFALGQSVIVPYDLPGRAGLTTPGAMYETKTRLRFSGNDDPEAVEAALEQRFPEAGLDIRTRNRASPGADRFVSRMGEFLTLVGLAALVIAGIGIGGGVSSYLEARRASIATFKILGATSRDIMRIYALQIGAAALAGAVAGLAVGVLVTPLLAQALGALLPVNTGLLIDPPALLRAAAFGLLVALIFASPPLVRARSYPAMALMRARVAPLAGEWRGAALPVGLGLAAIILLAIGGAQEKLLTLTFLGGAAGMLGLLTLIGLAIRAAARRAPRPASPIARLALGNLHRPGSSTAALVTALGFGLSAFVLLAAVQTSLDGNIQRSVPAIAPDYFVLDIPKDRLAEFEQLVEQDTPGSAVDAVPTLRGAILAYGPQGNQQRVSELEELPEGAWALRGERGLTYAGTLPEGNALTEGEWWPADYTGEPLVSVDSELAEAAGMQVGDYITIGVLGVERTARIASLRRIDWESMGFNYVLIFSPNTLRDAPHNVAATISLPDGMQAGSLLRDLVRAFPSSSVIEVGPLLTQAREILDQVALAILAAASVAVLAGIAVLLGAIAAARAARLYDTVILRVLGASRRQLLFLQLAEFGLLTVILAGVALALGTGLGWLVIVQIFDFDWLPDWPRILAVLGGGLVLVLAFAIGASLPLLRARPARALRDL
ncbi:putative ABC transport system permease protein [Altererythrobacter atlanticus]|uniref:FtsX-like permease family protein n=1 Tax=Croceibacterium atlanticum TaxID=1267766 RepID=A0A0F7KSV4_9SPHN|nr:FtsX-like permease family protein [Croceibacterium atlanticum]AKH42352.1 FtsX-like permease family protein [Croceibacterium atlanticum]MBB5731129.1 putative ABC transport system permease protein [Croceibacterium atlanticum]